MGERGGEREREREREREKERRSKRHEYERIERSYGDPHNWGGAILNKHDPAPREEQAAEESADHDHIPAVTDIVKPASNCLARGCKELREVGVTGGLHGVRRHGFSHRNATSVGARKPHPGGIRAVGGRIEGRVKFGEAAIEIIRCFHWR